MADLPKERTEAAPPFTNIGLDVLGPWAVVDGRSSRKNRGTTKIWAVLFICLYSRSVHIEPLPQMDTSAFKNSLCRFQAIRGPCKYIRSDRGTNIVAAAKEDSLNLAMISEELAVDGCQWVFNTPHSPHFGGIWERKVGQIKRCLDEAVMRSSPHYLSRDELHTLLVEASYIVNSTPLWESSYDPNEPFPLCPNHLITMIGWDPIADDYNESDLTSYGKRRWRRAQFIAQQFWKSYQKCCLQQLQKRQKWLKESNVEVGDVVLLQEPNVKRNHWPMGIVDQVKLSSDNKVRSVTVTVARKLMNGNTKKFTYERPVHKLIVLYKPEK